MATAMIGIGIGHAEDRVRRPTRSRHPIDHATRMVIAPDNPTPSRHSRRHQNPWPVAEVCSLDGMTFAPAVLIDAAPPILSP